MHKTSKGTIDFATYTIGLLAAMIGAIACYILALLGVITELEAALVMTITSIVGFVLVIAGVTLRARRSGRGVISPLLFGTGLLAAMGGSLAIYTLVLYQMVSETRAMLLIASIAALSIILIIAGIVYRAYHHVEGRESRMVTMPPLRRVYTRKVEEGQDGQNG